MAYLTNYDYLHINARVAVPGGTNPLWIDSTNNRGHIGSTELVDLAGGQTLTNKTLTGSTNSVSATSFLKADGISLMSITAADASTNQTLQWNGTNVVWADLNKPTISSIVSSTTLAETNGVDIFHVDPSNAGLTITLYATAGVPTQRITFVDASGNANSTSNIITIDAAGTETINGALTYLLQDAYNSVTLHHNGGGKWLVG